MSKHSPTVDAINKLDIRLVLQRLGYQEDGRSGETILMKHHGKSTDGRRVNADGNYANNFSGTKHRPQGGPFSVALHHFGGNHKETFTFFATEFGIKNSRYGTTTIPSRIKPYSIDLLPNKHTGTGM